ncbi:MAG: hypothetical protein HZA28_02440 [Candidatus Omnitrophica bacterium]|nr:hypothetical protein [Candidatus Omnitrophota bacterium]
MISYFERRHKSLSYRILSAFIAFTFIFSLVLPPGYAQLVPQALNLPAPGTMITLSPGFTPPIIKGVTIDPVNPFEFNFIIGTGDEHLKGEEFRQESKKMIKYFLAALTVPEKELWVNLSPYEKNRMIPQAFGETEMGKDLLAQDYILKQLTASLMYPEKELGKKFWDKVYQQAKEKYGTTEIPMNTFNKVWIVPQKAVVYEHGNSAFVIKSHLKVMLEEDYLAREASSVKREAQNDSRDASRDTRYASEIIKEVIIPAIETEVNEGKTFANLRQIYNSVILAAWYKQKLKVGNARERSLLGQIYVDQSKTAGVDLKDKTVNEKIYNQYLEAFKKGVYNYIKEDTDPATQEVIPRKYFSGGANFALTEESKDTSVAPKTILETVKTISPEARKVFFPVLIGVENQSVQIALLKAFKNTADQVGEVAGKFESQQPAAVTSSPILNLELKILELKAAVVKEILHSRQYTVGKWKELRASLEVLEGEKAAKMEEIRHTGISGKEAPKLKVLGLELVALQLEKELNQAIINTGGMHTNLEIWEARDFLRKLEEKIRAKKSEIRGEKNRAAPASSPLNANRKAMFEEYFSKIMGLHLSPELKRAMTDFAMIGQISKSLKQDESFAIVLDNFFAIGESMVNSRLEISVALVSLFSLIVGKAPDDSISIIEELFPLAMDALTIGEKEAGIDKEFYQWVIENGHPAEIAGDFRLVRLLLGARGRFTPGDIATLKKEILGNDSAASPVVHIVEKEISQQFSIKLIKAVSLVGAEEMPVEVELTRKGKLPWTFKTAYNAPINEDINATALAFVKAFKKSLKENSIHFFINIEKSLQSSPQFTKNELASLPSQKLLRLVDRLAEKIWQSDDRIVSVPQTKYTEYRLGVGGGKASMPSGMEYVDQKRPYTVLVKEIRWSQKRDDLSAAKVERESDWVNGGNEYWFALNIRTDANPAEVLESVKKYLHDADYQSLKKELSSSPMTGNGLDEEVAAVPSSPDLSLMGRRTFLRNLVVGLGLVCSAGGCALPSTRIIEPSEKDLNRIRGASMSNLLYEARLRSYWNADVREGMEGGKPYFRLIYSRGETDNEFAAVTIQFNKQQQIDPDGILDVNGAFANGLKSIGLQLVYSKEEYFEYSSYVWMDGTISTVPISDFRLSPEQLKHIEGVIVHLGKEVGIKQRTDNYWPTFLMGGFFYPPLWYGLILSVLGDTKVKHKMEKEILNNPIGAEFKLYDLKISKSKSSSPLYNRELSPGDNEFGTKIGQLLEGVNIDKAFLSAPNAIDGFEGKDKFEAFLYLVGQISGDNKDPIVDREGKLLILKKFGLVQQDGKVPDSLSNFIILAAKKGEYNIKISTPEMPPIPVFSKEFNERKEKVGGIDLNPLLMDLQVKRDGSGMPLPLPLQPAENMKIDGFVPVIINITPVFNLPMLLGLADIPAEDSATGASYNQGLSPMDRKSTLKAREPEEISALN